MSLARRLRKMERRLNPHGPSRYILYTVDEEDSSEEQERKKSEAIKKTEVELGHAIDPKTTRFLCISILHSSKMKSEPCPKPEPPPLVPEPQKIETKPDEPKNQDEEPEDHLPKRTASERILSQLTIDDIFRGF